ncbi:MAG: VanZ family protein [Burkholderiales bacterium]|nr:VanZ family protein [Burkholderiales bacterium]
MIVAGRAIDAATLRRCWLIIGWIGIGTVIWLSLTPRPPTLDIEEGDKLQHFAAYGSLAWWFMQAVAAKSSRLVWLGGLVAMGIGLEFAQRATGYRTFSEWDMLANTTGVAIGWLLAPPRLPNLLHRITRIGARR